MWMVGFWVIGRKSTVVRLGRGRVARTAPLVHVAGIPMPLQRRVPKGRRGRASVTRVGGDGAIPMTRWRLVVRRRRGRGGVPGAVGREAQFQAQVAEDSVHASLVSTNECGDPFVQLPVLQRVLQSLPLMGRQVALHEKDQLSEFLQVLRVHLEGRTAPRGGQDEQAVGR
jgi:hypothetical protein